MMRIGILTWYKELNHGAVLQAYASSKVIESLGYEAGMLDYDREITVNLSKLTVLKKRLKRIIVGDYAYRKTYQEFRKQKEIYFSSFREEMLKIYGDCCKESCDAVMIGSDMVFSLIEGYAPYMYGINIKSPYIFSYAACSGGTKKSLVDNLGISKELKCALNGFANIGCRDEETKVFVNSISGRDDIIDNIDPVLLYGFKNEMVQWDSRKWAIHKPYILIYAYHGNMNSKTEVEQIKSYAREHGLDVISCGYYHPWCDESVNADPKEFLEMFFYAQIVVTDTFHGTIFSLVCKKEFCSVIRENGFKLEHLLNQCGMSERIATNNNQIGRIMNQPTNYTSFNLWINRARNASMNYMSKCLFEANQKGQ